MGDFQGLLSIARKAGYAVIGQDNLIGYGKKLYLLLMDESAGDSLCREMAHLSNTKNIPLVRLKNLPELAKINTCKVIGIKNKNLADEMLKTIKGENFGTTT